MRFFEYKITTPYGLHALLISQLNGIIKDFSCTITIRKCACNLEKNTAYSDVKKVSLFKFFDILKLNIQYQDTVRVECEGINEHEALIKIKKFFYANL